MKGINYRQAKDLLQEMGKRYEAITLSDHSYYVRTKGSTNGNPLNGTKPVILK